MTLVTSHPQGRGVPFLRRAALRNPGVLWPGLLTLAGWVGLAALAGSAGGLALCLGVGGAAVWTSIDAAIYYAEPGRLALEWAAMVAAMMAPLALVSLAPLAARTAPAAKTVVSVAALLGYGSVWLVMGLIAVPVILVLKSGLEASGLTALAYVPAILWAGMSARQRWLTALHRVPLFYGGYLASDAARYGARFGFGCAITCLPIMAAPMVAGQGLLGMALVTHLLLSERTSPAPRALPMRLFLLAFAVLGALGTG